jgi:arylsulfatase A-like enzyme
MRFRKCAGAEHGLGALALGSLVGLAAACVDAALVVASPQRVVVWAEPWALLAYSGVTWCVVGLLATGCAAVFILASRLNRRPIAIQARLYVPVMLISAVWVWWASWALTTGRVASQLRGRTLVVATCGALAGVFLAWAIRWLGAVLRAAHRARRWRMAIAAWGLGGVCVWLDHRMLPRLYLPLHLTLFLAAVWTTTLGTMFAARALRGRARSQWTIAVGAVGVAAWLTSALAIRSCDARFVGPVHGFSQFTPAGSKWARLWLHWPRGNAVGSAPNRAYPSADVATSASGSTGHVWTSRRDVRHVLLITVDALRADRLRAYGGCGVTPFLDSLAEESVVWRRAYTPTPHTSYALASLHTGAFVRAAFTLGKQALELVTVAERLGRVGYQTAGFYPPAVFHVDRHRFAHWEQTGFGFQHRSVRDRSARELVNDMLDFLQKHPPHTPLLMWAHFLDPHEPYDPPPHAVDAANRADSQPGKQAGPHITRGAAVDRPEARYDGEVRAVDDALRALVPAFRRRFAGATVIVTADHGEEFGDHGGSYHGTTLYDEQVRVPLLWSAPWAAVGYVDDGAIGTQEVASMLAMAAGLTIDDSSATSNAGRLLERMTARHQATGPVDAARRMTDQSLVAFSELDGQRMVTDGASKMMCNVGFSKRAPRESSVGPCVLFDLQRDPQERLGISDDRAEAWRRLFGELSHFPDMITRTFATASRNADPAYAVLARARLGGQVALHECMPLLDHRDARVVEDTLLVLAASFAREAPSRRDAMDWARGIRNAARSPVHASATSRVAAAAALAASLLARPTREERSRLGDVARADYRPGDPLQQEVAWYLAQQRDVEVFPLLRAMALDAHADLGVRQRATRSMARLTHRDVMPTLVGLLQDVSLRAHAAQALGDTGRAAAIDPLRRALATETYPAAKEQELRSLERLGAARRTGTSR